MAYAYTVLIYTLCTFVLVFTVCDAAFQVCESKNAIEAKDWYFAGPGGWVEADGDDDDFAPPASGAAQAATHIEGKTWLIGTANGGIWKTPDITELPNPKWTNVLDGQPVTCTSISAMDSKDGVAVAGCGASTSSEMGSTWDVANSGDWGGVMISTDGGSSWSQTRFPVNFYVSSIVVFDEDHFLISARSHVTNATNGGVWVTKDRGATFERTFEQPVFDMKLDPASGRVFLACPWQGASAAAFVSDETNKYDRWLRWSSGITWSGNREAFYPTLAVGKENLFIGALTVNPKNLSDTGSDVFQRSLPTRGVNEIADVTEWNRVANAPRLDNDGMPKDRMALLVGPDDDTDDNGGVADKILFVAGNADALTWRVEWRNGVWTKSGASDTADRSYPHADCRTYAWEPTTKSLLLLNDGGAHLRSNPYKKGGSWRSVTGESGSMELISAHVDPKTGFWIGGAQDNSVQIFFEPENPLALANGIVDGDGTVTAIDSTTKKSSRFYGTTQFMGNFIDTDAHPNLEKKNGEEDGDDDDDHVGFAYATIDPESKNMTLVGVPLLDWFNVSQFPFFDHPYALLNTGEAITDGLPLILWARNGGGGEGGVFYKVDTTKGDTPRKHDSPFGTFPIPTTDVATPGDIYAFVAGGITDGETDTGVLVAINDTHLLHRNRKNVELTAQRLPVTFARPIEFVFYNANDYILGPVSHKRTVSLAVSPRDSNVVAVTGWQDLSVGGDSGKKPRVFLTLDAGVNFIDITGNLFEMNGVCDGVDRATCFDVRPSAILILPRGKGGTSVLVGTVGGIYVTGIPQNGNVVAGDTIAWKRLGTCEDFPIVLVGGLSYEPLTDTLVAATMGRGVRMLPNASNVV